MTERLTAGDAAPDFSLPTDTGETLSLESLRGHKVVLYAYPAAMTPGCTSRPCDFRDSLASLQKAGYEVVGISPDKPAKLAKFRERDALTFPLVSDEDRSVLTAYGVFGEKQLYGKLGHRRHPLDVRHRREGPDRARDVQRQGDRPRGEAAQGPRPRLSGLRRYVRMIGGGRSPIGRRQTVSGPFQCGFESRRPHFTAAAGVGGARSAGAPPSGGHRPWQGPRVGAGGIGGSIDQSGMGTAGDVPVKR